ncbi:MAG: hypothetical protein WA733_12515 [Methylocystis sp.]
MASYKDLMGVLGKLYGADEEALRGQMRGRVQNLQKMGIPLGLQVGKGRKINYERSQFYQIVLCMELAELGIMPGQIAALVRSLWSVQFKTIFNSEWLSTSQDDILFCFAFNLISDSWKQNIDNSLPMSIRYVVPEGRLLWVTAAEFPMQLKRLNETGMRHFSVINITALVRDVEKLLVGILPPPGSSEPDGGLTAPPGHG